MLQLEIPEREFFDDNTSSFILYKKESLQLEHSLVSLSKWESIWCKPFLSPVQKTLDETTDYIKCMTITHNLVISFHASSARLSNIGLRVGFM